MAMICDPFENASKPTIMTMGAWLCVTEPGTMASEHLDSSTVFRSRFVVAVVMAATKFPWQDVSVCQELTVRQKGLSLPSASHVITFSRIMLLEKNTWRNFHSSAWAEFSVFMFWKYYMETCSVDSCGKSAHSGDPCAEPMNYKKYGGQPHNPHKPPN